MIAALVRSQRLTTVRIGGNFIGQCHTARAEIARDRSAVLVGNHNGRMLCIRRLDRQRLRAIRTPALTPSGLPLSTV